MTILEKIKEAIETLGEGNYREIKDFIIERYGKISESGYSSDILSAAVNHTSRGHYHQSKKHRIANNPKYDFLFQTEHGTFVKYDPDKHGVWEMRADESGKFMPNKIVDLSELPTFSQTLTIRGRQFTFTPEEVRQAFVNTSEADWSGTPGISAYTHVMVDSDSKPLKAVFRNLPGVPSGFDFTTQEASRVFKSLGFVVKDTRTEQAQRGLCLIGTWKDAALHFSAVEEAIEQRGGWASWWSFPVEEAAQRLLSPPFFIYLNAGRGNFNYRMTVEEFVTSRGNNGIATPWPELTDSIFQNRTSAGTRQSEVFKTWLRISSIEQLDPPLTLNDMELARNLSRDTNVLNQNRFGYVYIAEVTPIPFADETDDFILCPEYPLEKCALETGIDLATLQSWVKAIDRKGQAVVYGPPGTGKTFVAERLAQYFTSEQSGFVELVQFHPAYSYEDFIQGIRPRTRKDGGLDYPLVPGRFLEFCEKAKGRTGCCVLILDEINRANLSRVFGELMYLLEYRDKEIPLAGGDRFSIPGNIRIIGTMNTADRSIALVDHALRRRFAFLELNPNYEILKKFHSDTEFNPDGLIEILKRVNKDIDDKHYQIGISYFLKTDIASHIEDIWRMEIEPYLEEYFFDRVSKVEELRWEKVQPRIVLR